MKKLDRLLNSCLLLGLTGAAPLALGETIPFDSERWDLTGADHQIENHLGREALLLKGGAALVKDLEFADGVIEYEVAVTGERGFMGAVWRLQDTGNFEQFYIRPHQSGNPDANQYQPVFNSAAAWQLYHGEGYGSPVDYVLNEWMPVRIVVSGPSAEIYVRDMETPAVFVPELKRGIATGGVGLLNPAGFASAHFSNFRVTPASSPPKLKSTAPPVQTPEPGTIMRWRVSTAFAETRVQGKGELADEDSADLSWKTLEAENTGLANLAKVQGIEEDRNTVFAATTLESEAPGSVRVSFGYSDRVRVYLNGQLIYAGNNGYGSRDYRYLGTIGYFDELRLPLRAGTNELWFAVSESFGGWGIMARTN